MLSVALSLLGVYVAVITALRARRLAWIRENLGKSVANDPHRLAWQLAFVEFPFMFENATALGFFSTFAAPKIASTLQHTRGFELGCQARYDDTMILMHEIGEHGLRSARGHAALERVNAIHARTPGIRRDEMLYTLWVFAFEPVRWVDAYEWRTIEPMEKNALFAFWREVGEGLQIANLPTTCEEFEAWGHEYEAKRFKRTSAAYGLTIHVIELAASWGPSWLPSSPLAQACKRQLILWILCALSRNQAVIDAIGLAEERERMPRLLIATIRAMVRARALLVKWLLPPRPNGWPATICRPPCHTKPRPPVTPATEKPLSDGEVAYRCPHVALTYRAQGSYRLSELGHPVAPHK
jgi:hypothetical protein